MMMMMRKGLSGGGFFKAYLSRQKRSSSRMTHPRGGNDNDRPVDNVEEEKERGKGDSREAVNLVGDLLPALHHLGTVLPVDNVPPQSGAVVAQFGPPSSAAKIIFTTSAADAAVGAVAFS